MRKVLLIDSRPDLASQVVDKSLLRNLGVSAKDKVLWRCEKGHEWEATVHNRAQNGRGCPYCSGRYAIPGETDLGTVRPDLARQLVDQSLVTTLKPTSHRKVEWQCEKGHVWSAAVASRVANGTGCPYCSGRKVWEGENDLATTHPELAAQLVDQGLATGLSRGSNKVVTWKCPECGHEWDATVNSRVNMGAGCPRCAGRVFVRGKNDLVTLYPELAVEMVDQKAAQYTFAHSNKKVAWRCPDCGYEWEASVSSRSLYGNGCPHCSGEDLSARGDDLVVVRSDLVAGTVDESANPCATSYRKFRWRCGVGHEWDAIVGMGGQASSVSGCPICAAMRGENFVR